MKIFSILSLCTVLVVCSSCGQKADEMKQAYDNMKNISNVAKNADKMQDKMNAMQARQEERRKKGDTLAMPYQELQKYLPSSISGYTAAEPEGQTMNMPGASYSTAQRRYTKDGGGDIEVAIADYNASAQTFAGLTAVWGAGFSMEDSHGYTRSYDTGIENVGGWEQYNKDNKEGSITYAAGGRFIVTVKGTQQSNTDAIKDIGKSMNLKELASK